MQNAFSLHHPEKFSGKHLLLVDDVITTGATLEACGNTLLRSGIKQLSLASIAFTC
ncbi:comF family protein [compost metagenome]